MDRRRKPFKVIKKNFYRLWVGAQVDIIWLRVKRAISSARSASLIVESAADRFSIDTPRFSKVLCRRFSNAPVFPREWVRTAKLFSICSAAISASSAVVIERSASPSPAETTADQVQLLIQIDSVFIGAIQT